ncbi:MAG: CAP domain-containing protein, partial [Acidimicrobiia bacterium]
MPSRDATRLFSRRAASWLTWLATAAVSVFALGLAPTPASAGESDRLLSLVNSARANAGLPPVSSDAKLNSIATAHAREMADAGRIYHNSSYP